MKIKRKKHRLTHLSVSPDAKGLFNNANGFTLIELILASALLGVVLATALSFYLFCDRSFQRGMEQSDLQQNLRLSLDLISRELRNADDVQLVNNEELRFSKLQDNNSYRILRKHNELVLIINYTETKVAYGITGLDFRMDNKNLLEVLIAGEEEGQKYAVQTMLRLKNLH